MCTSLALWVSVCMLFLEYKKTPCICHISLHVATCHDLSIAHKFLEQKSMTQKGTHHRTNGGGGVSMRKMIQTVNVSCGGYKTIECVKTHIHTWREKKRKKKNEHINGRLVFNIIPPHTITTDKYMCMVSIANKNEILSMYITFIRYRLMNKKNTTKHIYTETRKYDRAVKQRVRKSKRARYRKSNWT